MSLVVRSTTPVSPPRRTSPSISTPHSSYLTRQPVSPARPGFSCAINSPHLSPLNVGNVQRTLAAFHRESIPELDPDPANPTDGHIDTSTVHSQPAGARIWILSVRIAPPDLPNPVLKSLSYDLRYASFGTAYAFVQTDIIHSNGVDVPEGIITDPNELTVYSQCDDAATSGGDGYAPPMLNEAACERLSSKPSFKGADVSGWCHYSDRYRMYPNTRWFCSDNLGETDTINAEDSNHLHLFFHVHELSCAEPLRSIDVDVVAVWCDRTEFENCQDGMSDVDEIGKERERLMMATKEAEWMIKRLEKTAEECEKRRKGTKDLEERLLEIERRVSGVERVRPRIPSDEGSFLDKRDLEKRVDTENRMVEICVAIQKFREEVKQYRKEEEDSRELLEAENKERIKAEGDARREEYARMVEADKERVAGLLKVQTEIHDEVERYRRDETEYRRSVEAEKKERIGCQQMLQAEIEKCRRQAADDMAKMTADHKGAEERMRAEMRLMVDEAIEKEKAERKGEEEAACEEVQQGVRLPRSISEAPNIAKGVFEHHIKTVAESLGVCCNEGYGWTKKVGSYQCKSAGLSSDQSKGHNSHWLPFEDLGLE